MIVNCFLVIRRLIFTQQVLSLFSFHSSFGDAFFLPTGTSSASASASAIAETARQHAENPIDIFGIDHVVLRVDNLKEMAEWYETVLGCKIAKRNEKFQMIHLDAGSSLIDLVYKDGPLGGSSENDNGNGNRNGSANNHNMDHLCLGLNDFDEKAIREHLSRHGVAITIELGIRYGKGGSGESLYFEDPEGNRIEIRKSCLANTL